MATQVTNHKCPACTGPMHFDSQIGKLKCDYCDSVYTVEEVESMYAEKEEKAAQAFNKEEEKAQEQQAQAVNEQTADGQWSTENLNSDWGEDAENMRSYSCPSCGAELICDATTAATSCVYCGNPTVIPGQFSGAVKPDYVIPFKIDKEGAKQALKDHYKGKLLLPKLFSSENNIEEIKGVYVPVWLFSGLSDADISYHATNSSTRTSGDYRITTTRHYNVRRAGSVEFHKIPVDGSSKMPDEHMESIEPYDYGELNKFSTAYMPGFLADKYDVNVDDCAPRADARAIQSTIDVMRNSVKGYSSCSETGRAVNLHRGEVKYAMTPVWLLSTRYKGKPHLFAMNGQTGKFVGDLPVSWGKFWGLVASITGGLSLIASLVYLFL